MVFTDPSIDMSRAIWRKSARSSGNGGACVEVADNFRSVVAVRDSKDPHGPKLIFSSAAWRTFTRALRNEPHNR